MFYSGTCADSLSAVELLFSYFEMREKQQDREQDTYRRSAELDHWVAATSCPHIDRFTQYYCSIEKGSLKKTLLFSNSEIKIK